MVNTHYKFGYIRRTIESIELTLKNFEIEITTHPDPDGCGLFDQYEQFLGIGFAIYQTFLSSVHKGDNNKGEAFQKGPLHSSGKSYAQIINACANYWKHHEEWDKANLKKSAKITINIFEHLSVDVWSFYPLSQMFCILVGQKGSFSELLNYLNCWANEIEKEA